MNILFYTPINFRCRDIESLAQKFILGGHRVFLLSQCPEGPLHESARQLGVETSAITSSGGDSIFGIVRRVYDLVKFCRRNKIKVCFSHLEPTNFISVLAQYVLSARFIIYRHHIDQAKLNNFDRAISYRLTYRLARTIICVSRQARQYMIETEKVSPRRVVHIDLGYNFSLYGRPDEDAAKKIKKEYSRGILLVMAGRLTKYKRPELGVELLKRATDAGIECSLIFLGVGEDQSFLHALAEKYSISDRVFFIGYSHKILDFLAASDFLVHPSVSESSCVVVKEAALVGLPVLVCNGVGDFDDYMRNGENCVTVSKDKFVDEAAVVLQMYSQNPKPFKQMGATLTSDITSRFHIDNVIDQYNELIEL